MARQLTHSPSTRVGLSNRVESQGTRWGRVVDQEHDLIAASTSQKYDLGTLAAKVRAQLVHTMNDKTCV